MKQFVIAALMLGAAASAHAVDAAKAQEIANKNACMGCHQVDKKLVGPSYKDVAAKYKGDKNALATLTKRSRAVARASGARCRCPPTRRSATPI